MCRVYKVFDQNTSPKIKWKTLAKARITQTWKELPLTGEIFLSLELFTDR